MEKELESRLFMGRAIRVISFGQTEKLKWKLAISTTQETFNIYLIILFTLEWHIIWFLGFSSGKREICIWILSVRGWDWIYVSHLLKECHPLLYHLLLDVTLEVLLGFIKAFWKWNLYFRSFSYWIFIHTAWSISFSCLCSKFSGWTKTGSLYSCVNK